MLVRELLLSTLLFAAQAYTSSSNSNTSAACESLSEKVPGKVSYPNSTVYKDSISSYFSAQEQGLSPTCIVSPSSANDVATVIKTLSSGISRFAIRSGGHTPSAGAANIDNGVTVDLSALDSIELSSDHSSVQVGTGARWISVYNVLDPLNLTTPGGRGASIGVGGFLTGGGINFISPYAGWGCDSVIEYEVVLANGDIVTVNENSYSDLFIALKGGSNNFGVVTKFTLKTWPLGDFWAGFISYPYSDMEKNKQLNAFSNFMEPQNFDPHADMFLAFGFDNTNGSSYVIDLGLQYTKPQPYPPVFQPFIDNSSIVYNSMRISKMSDFVTEEDAHQINSVMQLYTVASFVHTPAVYSEIFNLFNATIDVINENVKDIIQWYLIIQPSPALNGTNVLGLNPADERVVLVLVTAAYRDSAHQTTVSSTAQELFSDINAATKALGVYRSFEYLNYAAPFQNPIDSYGASNKAKLRAASTKYDPEGLFQTGEPGGFKLFI